MRNLLDRWTDDPHKKASPNLATSQSKTIKTYNLNVVILVLFAFRIWQILGIFASKNSFVEITTPSF
jgi:hypothetical protein